MEGVTVTCDNITIWDSYKVESTKTMRRTLAKIESEYPNCLVWKRSKNSLVREWRGHNALYGLNIQPDRTRNVDLNYPLPWYAEVGYFILSICYAFR